jgi:hypothetical protein
LPEGGALVAMRRYPSEVRFRSYALLPKQHGVFFSPPRSADPILVNRLLRAHHFKSDRSRAHATQLRSLGWQERIANFLGLEDCIVADLTNGSPDYVFATLCYLEDYREILWVDDWPRFPVRLPPRAILVPRRTAVNAILRALDEAEACIIDVGKNRHLVVKKSEKQLWKAAVRDLRRLEEREAE